MNYFISDLIDEKIVGRFNEKELQKKKTTNQTELRIEKVTKKEVANYI